jgi:hypothetical protein
MIGPLGIKGIARVGIVWSRRIHRFFILRERMAVRPCIDLAVTVNSIVILNGVKDLTIAVCACDGLSKVNDPM